MDETIGKQQTRTDLLDPARAAALHASLGLEGAAPLTLPPFWHYLYFWDAAPADALGRDGHPKTGGFLPDMGLPRRMWAGGSLTFLHAPLLGEPAERISTITGAERKSGRSGPLALVTLSHELLQNGRLCVRETQDLIYRPDPDPNATAPTPPAARQDETICQPVRFSPTLLFRYSALTFNGHRIHYDRAYCKTVEGYPGLVVHGPLLAQLLIHLAMRELGGLSQFSFRATAPLYDFEAAELCARLDEGKLSLWVRGPEGRQCMTASAVYQPN